MTMRVFLSSTINDLDSYRKAIIQALERLGGEKLRMEVLGARADDATQASLKALEESDLFVGIYAHRYGYIPTGSTTSITEQEYDYAMKLKKPMFCFIINDDYPWPPDMIEGEPGRHMLLEFKAKMRATMVTDSFTAPEDLSLKVATAIGSYMTRRPESVTTESDETIVQGYVAESSEDLLPTMISTDRYTFDDKLGYKVYAYALARFLTDGRTRAPISISIQAPWGGGKTSLMRMVRAMIDKNAPQVSTDNNKGSKNVRLKEIKKELAKTSKEYPEPKKPEPARSDIKPRITIWFNAWTYESTEQVWAGLADSIVRGIADRLGRVEREWFYLRLNLRRRDPESIRKWISDRTFTYVWQKIVPWVWVSVSGIGAFTMAAIINWTGFGSNPNISNASLIGAILSGGLGFFKGLNKKLQTEEEPAEMALGHFIKVPDYNEKVGFIHNVVRDLELVFETIPQDYKDKPIIIFIDDLDRCSPTKIAQVVEGINLFLAGEFPGCIFIIGMDAEMVAAALEAAHKDVISNLSSYSDHMPIGWRFMDKFVQLPIIIPPSLEARVKEYVDSLLPQIQIARDNDNRTKGTHVTEGSSESLKFTLEESQILDEMGKKIDTISDTDEKFLRYVRDVAYKFSNNPRGIKRFINLLRFERFLMAEILKDEKSPEFDQVSRWIVLSLKWPQLVRWLYWNQNNHDVKNGLEKLEECAKTANDPNDWKNKMKSLLQVNSNGKTPSWLADENLMDFFKTEVTKYKKTPLSGGAGKGLY
jgi:hypothetical protein